MAEDSSSPSLGNAPHIIAGRYEVVGLLGVGGMGAVYKVRDRALDEVIALKMLKREIADAPGIAERFRREVKLARRVTHPNVARTFDLGEHDGERFLTMELIEGEPLQALMLRQGQLPLADVVTIVTAICAGLEAAHAAGVVHRDLKPDNVMIARTATSTGPRVVITDFGIARADEAGAASRTAIPVGTPAYMAPEQVEASPDVDARADLYALGAMMFELLTNHLPFEADSVFAIAAARLTQPPPDPRVHRPDLPEPIALLVKKCLARKPEDRFGSAKEIASRLASFTLPASEELARTGERSAAMRAPDAKTVAVLPFRNAGAPEDEYLADGLTDDLIDALSMTPGLRVRPRGVVMQHKDASDPRQLGRDLDVQVVVEGTLRVAGAAIRVSARAFSVEDGFQIWAKRFDGTRSSVLTIGDDAARAIAEALAVRKPTRAAMVGDSSAIDLYLRGRHEFMKFWSGANQRAMELLKEAHERAPNDPLIMAGYASSLARQFGLSESSTQHEAARSLAEKVTRIAPQLADGYIALANVRLHDADAVAAAAGVVRALSLSPLLPEAHELRARLLSEVGEPLEAIEAARRTLQLEPRLTHLQYNVIARAWALLGDWEAANACYAHLPGDQDGASLYWMSRTRSLMWMNTPEVAIRELDTAAVVAPFATLPIVRTAAEILRDRKLPDMQRAYLGERARTAPTKRMRTFWHQLLAEMKCYIGEPSAAIADIEAASELGLFDVQWIERCPLLVPAREDPAFRVVRDVVAARAARVRTELDGGAVTLATDPRP
jgi:serine/threonine-protein kinase